MPDKDCSVRVAVRSRPLSSKEKAERAKSCLRSPQEGQLVIGRSHAFTYDYVFEEQVNQEGVYVQCVRNLVMKFMKGFNATILAYGQTGSGKTYTMGTASSHNVAYDSLGIVPRVVEDIFRTIQSQSQGGGEEEGGPSTKYEVKVQFLEIYNDNINDLLNPGTKSTELQIRETKQGGISVLGAMEADASGPEDMLDCLDRGTACRVTGATAMNATSSRSHAIFSIILKQTTQVEMVDDKADVREDTITSKFHFVDLAGSERLKRTGAVGDRMREGININKGLLALGNVISALGDEKRKGSHVPFRDAKITRLLQDSLGGNSQTLMIACVSPSDTNFDETLNTLKYANRARNIKNKPVINRDPMAAKIEQMSKRIKDLEAALVASGAGDYLSAGISSEAYEEVTNQLVNAECEIKRLNKRLESSRQIMSTMREKVLAAETSRDKFRDGISKMKEKIKEAVQQGEGGGGGGGTSKLLEEIVDASADLEEENTADDNNDGGVMRLRRRVLELEAIIATDSSSSYTRAKPSSEAGENRRISLGNALHGVGAENDDDDDNEVEISTPYGPGNLVEMRDDGILVVELSYGTAYIRDLVSTPFGTGPVMERRAEPDPNAELMAKDGRVGYENGVCLVLLEFGLTNVPTEVCESHWLPEDDDDEEEDLGSDPAKQMGGRMNSDREAMEKEKQRMERLGALSSEVETLDADIEKKELLMKKLVDTQKRARIVEKDFKVKIVNLEQEVERIREERDRALKEINKNGGGSDSSRHKLVSKYQQKLNKLTEDLNKLRRKYQENQKLLRSKAKDADRYKRLQSEVSVHKKQRVVLQKKMREASEAHRSWVDSTRKELKKAVKEKNRAKLKVTKLQSKVNKQALIIKRREDEKEVLRQRLKMFQARARNGKRRRKRNQEKAQRAKAIAKMCSALEYELGEAVAKSDISQRLNEKLMKQKETKAQRAENKERLLHLAHGTPEYEEALEEADTLAARQQMIENQIVHLRTDLAVWKKRESPGNINEGLFKRHPDMDVQESKGVILQLLTKIVREEMRLKSQERAYDQLEAKYQDAMESQSQASRLSLTATEAKRMRPPNGVASKPAQNNPWISAETLGGPASIEGAEITRSGTINFSLEEWSQREKQQQQQQPPPPKRPDVLPPRPNNASRGRPTRRRGSGFGFGSTGRSLPWDRDSGRPAPVRSQSQTPNPTTPKLTLSSFGVVDNGDLFQKILSPRSQQRKARSSQRPLTPTFPFRKSKFQKPPHGGSGDVGKKRPSVFDRLTDKATFTGVYKTRAQGGVQRRRERTRRENPNSRGAHLKDSAIDPSHGARRPSGSAGISSGGQASDKHETDVFDRLNDKSKFTGMYKTRFTDKGEDASNSQKQRPRSRSNAEESSASSGKPDVFSRLTDKSSYTGMYRHREKVLNSQHSPRGGETKAKEKAPAIDNDALYAKLKALEATANVKPVETERIVEKTGPSFTDLSSQFNALADEYNSNEVFHKKNSKPNSKPTNPGQKNPPGEPDENIPKPMNAWGPSAAAKPTPDPGVTADEEDEKLASVESTYKADKQSVFDRLTDTSGYTGMYKLRQNKPGKVDGKKNIKIKARPGSGKVSSNGPGHIRKSSKKRSGGSVSPTRKLRTSMLQKELDSLVASAKGLDAMPNERDNSGKSSKGASTEGSARGAPLNVFERLTASTRVRMKDKASRSKSPPPYQ
mmetsp:Transcript_26758/g.64880  ORF Transcript_26758/g.64880 Transcript_26758/m.64880 type:complete len:1698 (+) Transcript_26758:95-5188(+)